jgi:hypothetical protein
MAKEGWRGRRREDGGWMLVRKRKEAWVSRGQQGAPDRPSVGRQGGGIDLKGREGLGVTSDDALWLSLAVRGRFYCR